MLRDQFLPGDWATKFDDDDDDHDGRCDWPRLGTRRQEHEGQSLCFSYVGRRSDEHMVPGVYIVRRA